MLFRSRTQLPNQLIGVPGNRNSTINNNITVRSNPVINVPSGTTQEQLKTISSYLETRTAELFSQQLTVALAEAPNME